MTVAAWSRTILDQVPDHVRADLATGLADALREHFTLTIRPAAAFGERGNGGWCDGVSIIDSGVILYRPTASRRQNFTLMHELGHHLVDGNLPCLTWLADQDDPNRLLEQLCDQIAADILIPATDVERILGPGSVGAQAVFDLFDNTEASRSVCVNVIARRLPCDGFVVLLGEGTSTVFYAARRGDTRPYAWQRDAIPAGHPLRQPAPPARTAAWWPNPTGERREYFMSSATHNGWTAAVFAENNLFGVPGFHLPQEIAEDRGNDATMTCPSCGFRGTTRWWPCPDCHKPQCPRCQQCDCARRDAQRVACESCFQKVMPHLLVDGYCDQCR